MRLDPLIDELPLHNVQKLAKILGPSSAAAHALEWAHKAKEPCYFFRSKSGALVAVRESLIRETGPLNNVGLDKHFVVVRESQYVCCIHCGKRNISNEGLAKLSHLGKCKVREASKIAAGPTPNTQERT